MKGLLSLCLGAGMLAFLPSNIAEGDYIWAGIDIFLGITQLGIALSALADYIIESIVENEGADDD